MLDASDIAAALRREDPFDDYEAFADIEPFVEYLARLIELKGWEELKVSLQGIYEITVDVLEHMIESGYCAGRIIARAALDNLLENLQEDAEDVADLIRRVNETRAAEGEPEITEEYLILREESEFNEETKRLYRDGSLTYGLLATTLPRVFFQYESAG